MIISDLNYLEEISQAPKIVGGMLLGSPAFLSVQINQALVLQRATASSSAFTYNGNAIATSTAINVDTLTQLINP